MFFTKHLERRIDILEDKIFRLELEVREPTMGVINWPIDPSLTIKKFKIEEVIMALLDELGLSLRYSCPSKSSVVIEKKEE